MIILIFYKKNSKIIQKKVLNQIQIIITITAKKEKEFYNNKNMIKVNPKKKPNIKKIKKKKKKKIFQIKLQKSRVNLKK